MVCARVVLKIRAKFEKFVAQSRVGPKLSCPNVTQPTESGVSKNATDNSQ